MDLIFIPAGLQIFATRAIPRISARVSPDLEDRKLAKPGLPAYIGPMNRRQFTRSLAALGLAPALPALPIPATAATAQAGYTPYMYGLGAHMARSTGLCSPEMLVRKLGLRPDAARAMQAQLIKSGILSAPDTAGMAMAARPYMASLRFKSLGHATGKAARHIVRSLAEAEHSEPAAERAPDQSAPISRRSANNVSRSS